MGVHELLLLTDDIRSLILRHTSASEIRAQAIKDGMIPMRRDGMLKVKEGRTSPYEIIRNVFAIGVSEA